MFVVAKQHKMSLGIEVGFGPGNILVDGDPAPSLPQMRTAALHFSTHVHCGQTIGWIKMPLGTEVGLGPGDIVFDGDPAPLSQKDAQSPTFRPMSTVAKRSPISATAELLLVHEIVRKFYAKSLRICPSDPASCGHCIRGYARSHFSAILFIHYCGYLRYFRIKSTANVTVLLIIITV